MYSAIALLVLSFSSICLADPRFVIHSAKLPDPSSPPSVKNAAQVCLLLLCLSKTYPAQWAQWYSSYLASIDSAFASYLADDQPKHDHAASEILDFATTATWEEARAYYVTATSSYMMYVTEAPAWFSELPEDVQSIKREEGRAYASIVAEQTGLAPKETAKAALGVLAGVAAAVAVL
ncbi:hypothetical protein OPT61_g9897 [Boeremia exigua]|uniref:Uncharacterized protein n=1 Tax=Boeremia exigua TaxID=749465 RepID=A0ACC2HTQ3_9PLEO|nr:hypothetical protein OPT61_g9897 [Boeremia exigua]